MGSAGVIILYLMVIPLGASGENAALIRGNVVTKLDGVTAVAAQI